MDEVDVANAKAEEFTADAVRAARAKLDMAPSNGICRSCEEAIEPERLRANPSAHLCCDCAAEEEAARKRAKLIGG